MRELDETIEDIEDVTILNKLRGSFKEEKQIPRFRDRVDSKRFRVSKHVDVINGTAVEIKGGL